MTLVLAILGWLVALGTIIVHGYVVTDIHDTFEDEGWHGWQMSLLTVVFVLFAPFLVLLYLVLTTKEEYDQLDMDDRLQVAAIPALFVWACLLLLRKSISWFVVTVIRWWKEMHTLTCPNCGSKHRIGPLCLTCGSLVRWNPIEYLPIMGAALIAIGITLLVLVLALSDTPAEARPQRSALAIASPVPTATPTPMSTAMLTPMATATLTPMATVTPTPSLETTLRRDGSLTIMDREQGYAFSIPPGWDRLDLDSDQVDNLLFVLGLEETRIWLDESLAGPAGDAAGVVYATDLMAAMFGGLPTLLWVITVDVNDLPANLLGALRGEMAIYRYSPPSSPSVGELRPRAFNFEAGEGQMKISGSMDVVATETNHTMAIEGIAHIRADKVFFLFLACDDANANRYQPPFAQIIESFLIY